MTENELTCALCEFLRQATKDLGNEAPTEKRCPPPGSLQEIAKIHPRGEPEEEIEPILGVKIFNGFVPSSGVVENNVPFVSILPQRETITYDKITMQLNLDLCTYASPGENPFMGLFNLQQRIISALFSIRNRTLAERFWLCEVSECIYDLNDYQPFLHASITTTWEWPSPFSPTDGVDDLEY